VRCEITRPLTYPALSDEEKIVALNEYQARGTGPLASNFLEAGAFLKSREDVTTPDLQHFFLMLMSPDYPEAGLPTRHGISLTSYINRPSSRGEVRLASADPLDRPIIDPRYLSDADDVRCAVAGVRWNLKMLYAKAFEDLRGEEIAPGEFMRDDTALEAFVRRTASTTWHPVGTCKMGNDLMAVVDATLTVHGLESLRVIDASIMPTIVSGNTNAPAIMIGEKGADLVRANRCRNSLSKDFNQRFPD
jgi:choline dehydrogenase